MDKIAIIYCRVSTEDQEREGTSLDTQAEACLRLARQKGYKRYEIIKDTCSGLTIDRPGLNRVRQKAKDGEGDAIIIHSPDRLSRTGEDILLLAKEFQMEGVKLLFVKEQWDDTHQGKLVAFMLGWASEFEASQIRERTMRGKRRHAEMGDIPSGFGRYPYWGHRYDNKRKGFENILGQIEAPREILKRYVAGESSSAITIDLQARGIKSATGGKIHRSAVNRVLSHAAVYAGKLTWNGIPIYGKVKPIITEEEADIIAQRLRRNKELSYGFGKRKPLTGRIFCGLCGKRYSLDASKGCRCNGSDPRNPVKCQAPKVSLKELYSLVYGAICAAITEDEALIAKVAERRGQWEEEVARMQERLHEKEAQLASFDKRRRLLSVQHELGGLTDEEYSDRLNDIEKEKCDLNEQLTQLKNFSPPKEPPKPENIRETLRNSSSALYRLSSQLAEVVPFAVMVHSKRPEREKQLQQMLDKLDVKVVVYPSDSIEQFRLDVFLNIPIERKEVGERVIVSPASS